MQLFLDKKNKKEIEKTILNDVLNNSSKKFQNIYKIKKYSFNLFLFSFSLFVLSFLFLNKNYQAFPLLFSLLSLFIYLYLNIIYKDLFISFFKKINNFTESFIKTYLKENNYSESISHLFLSYIVSVTPKGKILIDLKHFIGKKSLILTFYSILEKEININYQDNFGNTILHYIVEIKELRIFVGMALFSGANPNITNNEGISTRKIIEELYPEYISFMSNYELLNNRSQHNEVKTIINKKRL